MGFIGKGYFDTWYYTSTALDFNQGLHSTNIEGLDQVVLKVFRNSTVKTKREHVKKTPNLCAKYPLVNSLV